MNEKLEALYGQLQQAYGDQAPDYDRFVKSISIPERREGIYKAFTDAYGDQMPDFERFNRNIDSWLGGPTQTAQPQDITTEIESIDPDEMLNEAMKIIEAPNTRQDITDSQIDIAYRRGKEKEVLDAYKQEFEVKPEPEKLNLDYEKTFKELISPKEIATDRLGKKQPIQPEFNKPEDVEIALSRAMLKEEGNDNPTVDELESQANRIRNKGFSFTFNGLNDLFQGKLSEEQMDMFDQRLNERTYGQNFYDLIGSFGKGVTASGYDHAKNAVISELESLEEATGIQLTDKTKKDVGNMMASEYERNINMAVSLIGEGLGYVAPGMATLKLTGTGLKRVLPGLVNPTTLRGTFAKNAVELIPLDLLDAYNRTVKDERHGEKGEFGKTFASYALVNLGLGGLFGTAIQKAPNAVKAIGDKLAQTPELARKIDDYFRSVSEDYNKARIASDLRKIIKDADIDIEVKPKTIDAEKKANPAKPEKIKLKQLKTESVTRKTEPQTRVSESDIKKSASIVGLNSSSLGNILSRATKFVKNKSKKYLTTKGHIPDPAFNEILKSEGRITSNLRDIKYESRRFREAVKKDYGRKVNKSDYQMMDKALKGQAKLSDLPINTARAVAKMRNNIDALSRELIRRGMAQGDLALRIEENQGMYVTRSYELYDNPKAWRSFIENTKDGQRLFNRAVAYIKSQQPELDAEGAEGLVNYYLNKADFDNVNGSGSITKNNKDAFKQRERALDQSPEFRALYGEYTDPLANYSRTMGRIGMMIEKDKLIQDLRDSGLNDFLFEKPKGRYASKVELDFGYSSRKNPRAPDQSPKDLYTTPEIAEALKNFHAKPIDSRTLRALLGMNAWVKYGKTVLNIPITHVRNFIANPLFAISNGHWRLNKIEDATKATYGDLFGKKKFLGLVGFDDKSLKKWNDRYKEYLEYKVVDESTHAGEIYKTLREASTAEQGIEHVFDKKLTQAIRNGTEAIANFYRAEDDFWKIYAFENEFARYKKAMPKKSDDELKKIAAGIVRDTYPTYSNVPRGIRNISRFPVLGTFVSWPSEVIRTQIKTFQLARRELRNPETAGIGRARMTGVLTTPALGSLITAGFNSLQGIDKQEDLDRRRHMPPWDEKKQILYTGDKTYINLSYTDAKSVISDPIRILLGATSDKDIEDRILDASWNLLEPFASEEIAVKALLEIRLNKNEESGKPIYQDNDEAHIKWQKGTEYFWKRARPGVLSFAERIYNKDGKYDVERELAAHLSGLREATQDYAKSMSYKVTKFKKSILDAKDVYRSAFYSKESSRLPDAMNQSRKAIIKLFKEMREDYLSAIRLGEDQVEIDAMFKGVDQVAKSYILYGFGEDVVDEDYIKGKAVIQRESEGQ